MSVEAPKVVEETPVVKPVAAAETEAPAAAPVTETPAVATTEAAPETTAVTPAVADSAVEADKVAVEVVPATEGVLGYKAPGFLKQFVFSKNFFWFNEEASTADSLKKIEVPHTHLAWAQETGKGVLFYTKRAEDKAHPAGLILLAEATNLVKEGTDEFHFTVGKKVHRFEAANNTERDSWFAAIEQHIEESKSLHDEVTSRDSYKKTLEVFAVVPAHTKAARSSSKGPSKAVEPPVVAAATTTPAETTEAAPVAETAASVSSSDKEEKKAEKEAKKERSQSRKRASIFGFLSNKDEEKEAKHAEKEAKKAEKEAEKAAKDAEKELKKAEAEQIKEEKKVEAEAAKEEAKATHEPSAAVEAVEAAAIAAAPVAIVAAAEEKKEEKEEKSEAEKVKEEKKSKRSSVFGLFSKKVTSPTTEKTEKEAAVIPAADSDVPPVSETAPKLDEPIENKPIDTAAVTAPVDTVETPALVQTAVVPTEESTKEAAVEAPVDATAETPATAKTEKKGGLLGFIKGKKEAKEEKKEEKAVAEIAKDPVAAAAPIDPVPEPAVVSEPATAATETPVVAATTTDAPKDEQTPREKRRSSFFGSLGTIKKKAAPEGTEGEADIKREKSPLGAKIGGMFRKSSKGVKPSETEATESEAVKAEEVKTDALETPATTTVVEPTESAIVGDVVPKDLTATPAHEATTVAPSAVQTSA